MGVRPQSYTLYYSNQQFNRGAQADEEMLHYKFTKIKKEKHRQYAQDIDQFYKFKAKQVEMRKEFTQKHFERINEANRRLVEAKRQQMQKTIIGKVKLMFYDFL